MGSEGGGMDLNLGLPSRLLMVVLSPPSPTPARSSVKEEVDKGEEKEKGDLAEGSKLPVEEAMVGGQKLGG